MMQYPRYSNKNYLHEPNEIIKTDHDVVSANSDKNSLGTLDQRYFLRVISDRERKYLVTT